MVRRRGLNAAMPPMPPARRELTAEAPTEAHIQTAWIWVGGARQPLRRRTDDIIRFATRSVPGAANPDATFCLMGAVAMGHPRSPSNLAGRGLPADVDDQCCLMVLPQNRCRRPRSWSEGDDGDEAAITEGLKASSPHPAERPGAHA